MAEQRAPLETEQHLRRRGLRVTRPRVLVLESVTGAATPLSHADVVVRLAASGLDRATIYRNLQTLADVGLLRRVEAGDRVFRFEGVGDGTAPPLHAVAHAHFVCTACGEVRCLPDDGPFRPNAADVPGAAKGRPLEVQLRGTCEACVS